MSKFHVKKGDEVVLISGSERGKRGKVIQILAKKDRVIVEGIKMIKKHTKRSQAQPQGAIIEREGSVHLSSVMLAETYDQSKKRQNQN
jgi:large subunit ribosomal protein L24